MLIPLVRREPKGDIELEDTLPSIRPEDIVVEIGANIGGSTIPIAKRAKRVYAFEPNPVSFKILRKYSKPYSNLGVFNFAISNRASLTNLNFESSISRGASIKHERNNCVKVPCETLDSFELKPTVLLLDCEGSEIEALQGAQKTLKHARTLIIETHYLKDGLGTLEGVSKIARNSGFAQPEILRRNQNDQNASFWESVVKFQR